MKGITQMTDFSYILLSPQFTTPPHSKLINLIRDIDELVNLLQEYKSNLISTAFFGPSMLPDFDQYLLPLPPRFLLIGFFAQFIFFSLYFFELV
jgi:hypothetical protein